MNVIVLHDLKNTKCSSTVTVGWAWNMGDLSLIVIFIH